MKNEPGQSSTKNETKMTRAAASRIQAATCRNNNGMTPQYSFASRAMSAAYKNEPSSYNSSKDGEDKSMDCNCRLM